MSSAISPFFRDTSFDLFLFAAIGEAPNGMSLSVQSALARLDLDPWREAANLSSLTPPAATERLTGLLYSLPSSQLKTLAPSTITRLLGRTLPKAVKDDAWARGAAAVNTSKASWPVVICTIIVLVMICAGLFIERRAAVPTHGGGSPAASADDRDAAKP